MELFSKARLKTILGSVLFVCAFFFLAIGVWDLKHPRASFDTCTLVGQGLSIKAWKENATLLYSNDGRPSRDIALACDKKGHLWLNDDLILAPNKNQRLLLTTNHYHFLPTRFRLALHVINPDPVEVADGHDRKVLHVSP